jgi:hypothetical protein
LSNENENQEIEQNVPADQQQPIDQQPPPVDQQQPPAPQPPKSNKVIIICIAVLLGLVGLVGGVIAAGFILFDSDNNSVVSDEIPVQIYVQDPAHQTPSDTFPTIGDATVHPEGAVAIYMQEVYTLAALFYDAEDPMLAAVSQLLDTAVLKERAQAHGIVLTAEEKQEVHDWAENLHSMYSMFGVDLSGMSVARMAEILEADLYYEKLMDIYTQDLIISEEDVLSALVDFKENRKIDYYEVQVKFAYTQALAAFEAARDDVVAGVMTFDQLVEQHHVEYNPEAGPITAALWQLYLEEADNSRILALAEGEVSDIIVQQVPQGDDFVTYYLLVQVVSKEIPPDDELEANFRLRYTWDKKIEVFEVVLEAWKSEAEYIIY